MFKLDLTTFNEKVEELEQAKKDLAKKTREEVFDTLVEYLKENQEKVNCIGWNQFTPYFNDGESCEFSVGAFYIGKMTDEWLADASSAYNFEDLEDEGTSIVFSCIRDPREWSWYKPDDSFHKARLAEFLKVQEEYGEEELKFYDSITTKLSEIPDDVYHDLFGDHVRVFITPKGLDVEEFDHD